MHHLRKLILIPTLVSSLRIAVLPLFIYRFSFENTTACLVLMAFSASTDYFDGWLARKLGVTSRFGAYYDAATDFTLIFGIFAFLSWKGFYPVWLPLVITLSFAQFLASSYYAKKIYDPVGKYTGSALYIGVVLTLVYPSNAVFVFVEYAFLAFFLVSFASRIVSLTRKQ